jgi:DNA polymerase I-like protein with 3'-5' exonuclease and polymerase domains
MDFDLTEQLEQIGRPTISRKGWMNEKKLLLATAEMLPRIVDECIASKLYALDLETTGLDSRVFNGATIDRIAGACISADGVTGYYIPVYHPNHMDRCVSFSLFTREMRRLVASPAVAVFHNGKFDQEFLQFNGGEAVGEWDDPKKWEDTLILAYLRDSRARNKGLKHLSKVELGMEMIELEELFTKKELDAGGLDFGALDPSWEPAIWYAASDAICTFLLYKHIRDAATKPTDTGLPSQEPLYVIEKLCVAATRWMERCRIPIDRAMVAELIRVGQREWLPALGEVYAEASKALGRDITPGYFRLLSGDNERFRFDPEDVERGIKENIERTRAEAERQRMDPCEPDSKGRMRVKTIQKRVPSLVDKKLVDTVDFPLVYDVLVPDQLGLLLRELGVEGLIVTEKSGQVKTSKDVLDKVIEEAGEDFPYIKKIKRFREVAKAIASNLHPIYEATTPEKSPDGRIRVNFEAFKTDTGRFSTPQEREGRGWTGRAAWNIQSIPSGKKKDIPECLKRIREVIRAPDGKKLYAIDFSGQELRVVTNLSHEPLWENEFFRCAGCGHTFDRGATVPPPPEAPPPFCPSCGSDSIGDIHTLTTIALHGADIVDSPDFKQRRGEAKGVNFALCYGGGGSAVVRSAGVTKDEGWRIKRQFDATYKVLSAWWGKQHEFARRTKHVLTAFNRRCPLPDIDSADGGFRSKAERNAVNAPIQGTGADLMKYSMGLLYRECKKRGWLDKCKAIITMHDELVFEIDDDVAAEALDMIVDIMLRKVIAKLAWRVPLTCDVEAGTTWAVPWNITKIRYGKQAMPPELAGVFTTLVKAEGAKGGPEGGGASGGKADAVAPPPAPGTAYESPAKGVQIPDLPKGADFVYVVRSSDLTMRMQVRLANVIQRCRGRGSHPFKIVTETGEPLWDGEPIYVNAGEASVLLNMPEA